MKIKAQGVSEVVLEVNDMKRAVDFWSGQLGFPVVQQWGYQDNQFTEEANEIWATWLYVGGPTRLGLWLPRNFNNQQLVEKASPVSLWNGLFDEGGVHVHLALYIGIDQIEAAIHLLESHHIDNKIITRGIHKRVYFKDTENNVIEFYTQSMEEDYLSRLNPM
ncbi:VOC family protein [Paenibacillus sp. WQ 127069]|jgi:catechol 2,3-dioxygenase-like lactoylglutathione lyase family enzyme|uniref:VOC family protein n=1 Tax=Paenibacillus baimaensis TaxID=2982185 RepID=A0ABT2UH28_9BACL|nr:VOC family protein [Paenibacillus sp. WQ 127069]MCU6793943.1 VOC family protein [Paenibacillus sp. WQ 127069]